MPCGGDAAGAGSLGVPARVPPALPGAESPAPPALPGAGASLPAPGSEALAPGSAGPDSRCLFSNSALRFAIAAVFRASIAARCSSVRAGAAGVAAGVGAVGAAPPGGTEDGPPPPSADAWDNFWDKKKMTLSPWKNHLLQETTTHSTDSDAEILVLQCIANKKRIKPTVVMIVSSWDASAAALHRPTRRRSSRPERRSASRPDYMIRPTFSAFSRSFFSSIALRLARASSFFFARSSCCFASSSGVMFLRRSSASAAAFFAAWRACLAVCRRRFSVGFSCKKSCS